MAITVALAEDSLIVREGLQQLLSTEPDITLVASCGDLDSLLEAVETHAPDVVLTDIRMPPNQTDEGIRAATTLHETHPQTGVVVLSQYGHPSYALALLAERVGSAGVPAEATGARARRACEGHSVRGRRWIGD